MSLPRRFTFPDNLEHEPECRCGRCYTKAEFRALVRRKRLPGFKWDERSQSFIGIKVPRCYGGLVPGEIRKSL